MVCFADHCVCLMMSLFLMAPVTLGQYNSYVYFITFALSILAHNCKEDLSDKLSSLLKWNGFCGKCNYGGRGMLYTAIIFGNEKRHWVERECLDSDRGGGHLYPIQCSDKIGSISYLSFLNTVCCFYPQSIMLRL